MRRNVLLLLLVVILGLAVTAYVIWSRRGPAPPAAGIPQTLAEERAKRISDLLSITKILTVFETYDNEADAVRSFFSSANV